MFLTIPNAFTLSNLVFGIISIAFSISSLYLYAFIAIFLAIICDGLDGFVARKLNAANEFGRELDSLSDQVSFGVAPAVLLIKYTLDNLHSMVIYSVFFGAVFAAFGALRLARFNISGTTKYFEGLAIPAAAFYASVSLLCFGEFNLALVFALYFVIAILMISSIIYPSAKVREGVKSIAMTILVGVLLAIIFIVILEPKSMILLTLIALFGIMTAYAFVSPIIFRFVREKNKTSNSS